MTNGPTDLPERRSARPRRALLMAVGISALLVSVPVAATEGESIKMTDGSMKLHKEYPPIAGADPSAQALTPSIADCRDRPFGNILLPIEMSFKKDFGHVLEILITWQAPEAVDVDIYFFDETGEIIADSATGNPSEIVRLGSLANGQYYLCVRNFYGPNTGFVLDASVRYLTLPAARTPPPATNAPTSAPPRTSAQTTPQPGAGALKEPPVISAEPVQTPGADGPFADRGLINVAGARQAARDEGGRSLTEIIFLGLTGAIAVAGVALVVVRIRRDTTT